MSEPTNTWTCSRCERTVVRWRGQSEIQCACGAWYNAGAQMLREDWAENPSVHDEQISDLEGFELQQAAAEQRPEEPTKSYLVRWEIDADAEDPRAAALRVWTENFGRLPEPSSEECCVFEVIDAQGTVHTIDLSAPVEDLP